VPKDGHSALDDIFQFGNGAAFARQARSARSHDREFMIWKTQAPGATLE